MIPVSPSSVDSGAHATVGDVPLGLVCPHCRGPLKEDGDTLACTRCGRGFPLDNGIPDFRDRDEYWCNVDREKMRELITQARESGDWLTSAHKLIPQYAAHFDTFERADTQFLWPTTADSRILDAGCMWGGLTLPAAQYHREVYAVDKTMETLSFLKVRAGQMGLTNITPIACPLRCLPFPTNYFDLVILSGVLEWVALDQDVVLEEHWGKRRTDHCLYHEDPRDVQLAVLRELHRVLKPEGSLYLAIENSIGYIYLLGVPDDHVNLRFVSFLPRRIANAITRWKLNLDYRTYVYSVAGYDHLMRDSGFASPETYAVFDHYINPRYVVPLELVPRLKKRILAGCGRKARFFFGALPARAMQRLAPSLVVLATKPREDTRRSCRRGSRIAQILKECGLMDGKTGHVRLVKWPSRRGNHLPVHYWVYTEDQQWPAFFCKICRSRQSTEIVEHEAANLRVVTDALKESELHSCVPELSYCGTVDGVTLMVTTFLTGEPAGFAFHEEVLRLIRKGLIRKTELALGFLAQFQACTRHPEREVRLADRFTGYRTALARDGDLSLELKSSLDSLQNEVDRLGDFRIPLVGVHGDFDFFYNILFHQDRVQLVDFEQFEPAGPPFLDLATLILTPLIFSHEYEVEGMPLSELERRFSLSTVIGRWISRYAQLSGIGEECLRLVPALAALESRTKKYPNYRDPNTFPLRRDRTFHELLNYRFPLVSTHDSR